MPRQYTCKVFAPGTKIHSWTVIGSPIRKRHGYYHPCKCQCGAYSEINTAVLNNGKSKSCRSCSKHPRDRRYERIIVIWEKMRSRCNSPKDAAYSDYGGRGITICDEWKDYNKFLSWSLSNGYAPHLTIDRRNNDAGYGPDNCRWITSAEQQSNRRNNIHITAFGETKILAHWIADPRCQITRECCWKRFRLGWSYPQALFTPPYGKPITYNP